MRVYTTPRGELLLQKALMRRLTRIAFRTVSSRLISSHGLVLSCSRLITSRQRSELLSFTSRSVRSSHYRFVTLHQQTDFLGSYNFIMFVFSRLASRRTVVSLSSQVMSPAFGVSHLTSPSTNSSPSRIILTGMPFYFSLTSSGDWLLVL